MCQGEAGLARLSAVEESGAVVINSALAIRNCYRDLLGAGLMRAGVPVPEGVVVRTAAPLDLKPLRTIDLSAPMYVKRGNLHALGTARRGARRRTRATRSDADYASRAAASNSPSCSRRSSAKSSSSTASAAVSISRPSPKARPHLSDPQKRALNQAAANAATALGLEVWGGDAIVKGDRLLDR